jgi:signal peptide peptidase SppA
MIDHQTRVNVPWAIQPEALKAIVGLDPVKCEAHPKLAELSVGDFREKIDFDPSSGVAIISVSGPLMPNPALWERYFYGATDLIQLEGAIRAAALSPQVRALVLDIESPGGTVTGTPEVGNAVAACAALKPVLAFTNTLMASAAYWIGAKAGAIYATESARIGSVGVIRPHIDLSKAYERDGINIELFTSGKFKGAGAHGTALTEDQREQIQAETIATGERFRATVTDARPNIKAEAMEGQVFYAKDALAAGLIDRVIGNREEMIALAVAAAISGKVDAAASVMAQLTPAQLAASDALAAEASAAEALAAETLAAETLAAESLANEAAVPAAEAALTDSGAEGQAGAEADSVINAEESAADEVATLIAGMTSLAAANAGLAARLVVLEAEAKSLEARAAEIAAQSGADPAEVTPGATPENPGAFANLTGPELWEHAHGITGKDDAETSALRHAFYLTHIKPRQGR